MSETSLHAAPTPVPTHVPTETLASRLKQIAFKAYVDENWPEDVPDNICDNYNHDENPYDCFDQGLERPCASCLAYYTTSDRLVAEFQAIPVRC